MASGPPKTAEENIEELSEQLSGLNKLIETTMKKLENAKKNPKIAERVEADLTILMKRASDTMDEIKDLRVQLVKNLKSG